MSNAINPQETSHTYHRREIFDEELDYINTRREKNGLDSISNLKDSWGICFSGGGIRSATLCLGILQKFTREKVFRFFDFLSTVSGGGYIGSCLTSLLSKSPEKDDPFNTIQTGVDPENSPFVGLNQFAERVSGQKQELYDYEEAGKTRLSVMHQMHHMRTHGEYLIAKKNILSRDLQRAVGTIFAGILHHLALFTLLLISLITLLHFSLFFITRYPEQNPQKKVFVEEVNLLHELNYSSDTYYKIDDSVLTALKIEGMQEDSINQLKLFDGKVFYKGKNHFISELDKKNFPAKEKEQILKYASYPNDSKLDYLKCSFFTWLCARIGGPLYHMFYDGIKSNLLTYGIFIFVGGLWGFLSVKMIALLKARIDNPPVDSIESANSGFNIEDHYESKFIFNFNIISFMIAILIIFCGVFCCKQGSSPDNSLWVLFLPLAFTSGAAVFSVITSNIHRFSKVEDGGGSKSFYRSLFKPGQERISRSLYNGIVGASLYGIIFAIVIPIAIVFLFSLNYFDLRFWWTLILLAANYFIFKENGKGGKISKLISKFKKPLMSLLIFLFTALACNGISDFFIRHVYPNWNLTFASSQFSINLVPLVFTACSFLTLLIMGFTVDSNLLSPHYFYRDRLTEAYLKTDARIKRKEKYYKDHQGMPLVNVRDHEDLKLSDMGEGNGHGPYHIIVAALNLQGSDELNRKQMLSEHFIFSKFYIGSKVTGFVKTKAYRSGFTKLARAMTISAAAAGSAMGQLSFGAQAFASTLFNVRLGYWMANPWFYIKDNNNPEPKRPFWPKWLMIEMLGKCNARRRMINLSDGGHTGDNLGLIPLLQRRCKVIVVCDGEADPSYKFESFNNAVRMAIIEENITIDINLDSIIPEKNEGQTSELSRHSVAAGTIIYPPEIKGEHETYGKLIYIKSSLSETIKSLPVHVKNYRAGHNSFPHQSTADQFFDDAQFEAYRSLGEHIGEEAIKAMEDDKIIAASEAL